MLVVKAVEMFERKGAPHELRRLVVLQRDDGHFAFAEEYHYRTEYDGKVIAEGWARLRLSLRRPRLGCGTGPLSRG
jgi:hypothetical protein